MELLAFAEMFGPILGLVLFMVWKQVQIGSLKQKLEPIEKKLDGLVVQLGCVGTGHIQDLNRKLERLLEEIGRNEESTDEPDDSNCDLPDEEAVRGRPS